MEEQATNDRAMDEQPTVAIQRRDIPATSGRETKRLSRPQQGRMFLGVCAGLGRYFDVDPVVLRAIFAVTTLLLGSGVIVYLVLALVMPHDTMVDEDPRSAAQATVDEAADEIRRGINRAGDAVRRTLGRDKHGA